MNNRQFRALAKPYVVSDGRRFRLKAFDPAGPGPNASQQGAKKFLKKSVEALSELQEKLYAQDRWGVLLIFQAMDAAGKDSAIKHVMSGVDPKGCQVYSFKAPSSEELDHDFMWRTSKSLPERGRIGIFNRSYYEETLVVRVHPEYLGGQEADWEERFDAITGWERHLHASGTRVVKFFLNVSEQEQRERFLSRAEEADKNWKFSAGDVVERERWDEYQHAFEQAIRATSTKHAPWYVIPADHKWLMRTAVASILVHHLEAMDPRFPEPSDEERAAIAEAVARLRDE